MSQLDSMRVAEITGLLSHVAGILDSLPLAAYADAIQADADKAAGNGSQETAAAGYRRARRIELSAAAGHANEFAQAVQAAGQHARAAYRADLAEQAAAVPPTVRAFNGAHAAAIRQAYPGTNVVSLRSREEEVPSDGPA